MAGVASITRTGGPGATRYYREGGRGAGPRRRQGRVHAEGEGVEETGPSCGREEERCVVRTGRRATALVGTAAAVTALVTSPSRAVQVTEEDLAVTNTVYFDVGLCPTATNQNRTLGAKNIFCTEKDLEYLGRIEIGLYGNLVPVTVKNFVQAVEEGVFDQTIVHKVLRGQYILAGKPGARKYGEVEMPETISRENGDLISSKAFALQAGLRPGTVSLYLQDDKSEREMERRNLANLEFAITTGPGPAPDLNDRSVVLGTVTKGFDVISEIAEVPTFQPNKNLKSFNKFAALLGDDRANNARGIWGKPRKAVIFIGTGQVKMQDAVAGEESGPMPMP